MPHGYEYRLAESDRRAMKEELRAVLRELAANREIATYTQVASRLTTARIHPGSYIFSHLLREVCGEELATGNGMLCALVVSKSKGIPGAGYFTGTATEGRETADLVALWQQDVQAVFELWSKR